MQPVGAGAVTHLLTAQLGYVGALRATFLGAAAIYAALGLYVLLVVRESVSVSARGQASFGGGRLGRILKEGNPLAMLHFLGTDRVLLTVAVVFSVSHFAMSGTSTIEKLYQEYLFSWEALQQGYVQSVSSVVSVGSKVVVLPVCVALFRERKAVAVIFTIAAAGYGCTAAAGLPMHGGALDLGRTARVAWCGSGPDTHPPTLGLQNSAQVQKSRHL